jgi:hypothetical protein
MVPQKQDKSYDNPSNTERTCNMHNLSDKVTILGLLKDS